MKLVGFLVGAGGAAVAVTSFNAWRHVSDDDLLTQYLADHCLPYVATGAPPFGDLGRVPGVYDAVELRDRLEDAGAAILNDNRFVAQWGISTDTSNPANQLRVCDVSASFAENTIAGFVVDADGFVARYTDVIATTEPLVPEVETLDDGPRTMGWFGADRAQSEGLRVVMIASPGLVSSVLVVGDAD